LSEEEGRRIVLSNSHEKVRRGRRGMGQPPGPPTRREKKKERERGTFHLYPLTSARDRRKKGGGRKDGKPFIPCPDS